ncbi:hypothetical protein ACPPVO_08195 [Dactylosporangium sp. McL0621]|uniref:hypothetical protein n=1 Tax=Dactylosporangium sp. McL0621 TaxID=3415678 RepID=UPI003CE7C5E8
MTIGDDQDPLESTDLDSDDAVWLPAGTLARMAGRDPAAGLHVVWSGADSTEAADMARIRLDLRRVAAERRRDSGGTP